MNEPEKKKYYKPVKVRKPRKRKDPELKKSRMAIAVSPEDRKFIEKYTEYMRRRLNCPYSLSRSFGDALELLKKKNKSAMKDMESD